MSSREKIVLFTLSFFVFTLYVVKIYSEQRLVSNGYELYTIHEQTDELRTQNMHMRNELLHRTTLRFIAQWARSQGFVEASSVVVIH